jgi:16S rRNA (uracil1498-N3)-methyltransferase
VARRIHVPHLCPGDLPLDPAQARHARSVLRLTDGAAVEVFDDAGRVAAGVLLLRGPHDVAVRVERVEAVAEDLGLRWTVAAAVPKGERADWMVEKLSELGTAAFVPLAAARSVVLPEGRGKRERWVRIATESAKQCRRAGVMRIGELTPVAEAVAQVAAGRGDATNRSAAWYLSTAAGAVPAVEAVGRMRADGARGLTLFIGPEGGWTDEEMAAFDRAGCTPVRLTATVLRVETAAVAAAAVVGVGATPVNGSV